MSAAAPVVRLETPDGPREFQAQPGDEAIPLTDLLARHDLPLNTRCGGRGLCSGCEIRLLSGGLRRAAGTASIEPGTDFRACQARLAPDAPAALEILARSLLRHNPAVVAEFRIDVPWARDPVRKGVRFGAAVDIGTTTVVVLVCDLESGRVLGEASGLNAQVRFGEDVLTRIQLCGAGPANRQALQQAIAAGTIQPLLERACAAAGVERREVGVLTVAGNTTMLHLLAGVDPSPMGVHPFKPAFLAHRTLAPKQAGLDFGDPEAEVHLLPGAAAYVGADIAAGIVATRMLYEEGPVLLVDVGTNGEIVARVGDRMVGCATAAGPAFEGAGLVSGMRAADGAIQHIRVRDDGEVECSVIGETVAPIGVCGSAYVDFLWEARKSGWLDANGRFTPDFVEQNRHRIAFRRIDRRFRVHSGGAAGPVWISEVDIARLLQAKAAIAAGIHTLLRVLGTTPEEVRTVHLAGGFGLNLSIAHSIGCGLLPGFRADQIEIVGNSSLGGAYLALNDRSLLDEMSQACARLETIELNLQPGFEDTYIDNLGLP